MHQIALSDGRNQGFNPDFLPGLPDTLILGDFNAHFIINFIHGKKNSIAEIKKTTNILRITHAPQYTQRTRESKQSQCMTQITA